MPATGTYIDQSDLETAFGETNIAQWSNREGDGAGADTTSIQAAIDKAEAFVVGRLRNKFSIPLTPLSGGHDAALLDAMVSIAAFELFSGRGNVDAEGKNRLDGNRERALGYIRQVVLNLIGLDYRRSESQPVSAPSA